MFRKFAIAAIFLLSVVFISGCLGGSEEKAEDGTIIPANYKYYSTNELGFIYFQEWEILLPKDFLANVPPELIVSVRDNLKKKDKFITNVTITKNKVEKGLDSLSYGKSILSTHKNEIINFNLENEEIINTKIKGEDQKTLYIVFTGKIRPEGDILRFYQKYAVKEDLAYIATIVAGASEEDLVLEKAKNVLKTLSIK